MRGSLCKHTVTRRGAPFAEESPSNSHVMKHTLALLTALPLLAATLHAQGPLDPPGAPAPTMKTLQELWDKMEALEAQNAALEARLQSLGGFAPFTMEMVTVGNAGNTADTTGDPNPAGAVAYEYKIGKYEVTNAQYAQFLNAVAKTDTHGLYDARMGSNARAGITQAGASPNFSYAVKANMENKPVNYVNWYDCLRFCNWLHNGQPAGAQGAGTTEDGAYTLTGTNTIQTPGTAAAPHGANGRNAGALYHLPGENEWYKAAYYEPGASTIDLNEYWLYPTQSDSAPTLGTADTFGNIDNDTVNIANYDLGADWNGQDGNVTTVGSGGPGSESFFGAADMGGNVSEWNEENVGGNRGLRGGSWGSNVFFLQSSFRSIGGPAIEGIGNGFRVAGAQ